MGAPVLQTQQGLNTLGQNVVEDGVYGPQTRNALMAAFGTPMTYAIKHAENNPRNHGVLSVKTTNPSKVLRNSVRNTMDRFMTGQPNADYLDYQPDERFVDFMKRRWAPDNAPNDPDNLNPNWAPNVRDYLQKNYPDQYEQWKAMNLVKNPGMSTYT